MIDTRLKVNLLRMTRDSLAFNNPVYRATDDNITATQCVKAALVDLFHTSGVTLHTQKIRADHLFTDLIVDIKGRQHHIYSQEAKAVRARCFYNPGPREWAPVFYVLHKFHDRNWHTITNTDRFQVVPSLSLPKK